jgi:hypothetical protein
MQIIRIFRRSNYMLMVILTMAVFLPACTKEIKETTIKEIMTEQPCGKDGAGLCSVMYQSCGNVCRFPGSSCSTSNPSAKCQTVTSGGSCQCNCM